MNRIDNPSAEVNQWFIDTYGQPQYYFTVVKEPERLSKSFKWAIGKHGATWIPYHDCIWCDDDVYAWYLLAWN